MFSAAAAAAEVVQQRHTPRFHGKEKGRKKQESEFDNRYLLESWVGSGSFIIRGGFLSQQRRETKKQQRKNTLQGEGDWRGPAAAKFLPTLLPLFCTV